MGTRVFQEIALRENVLAPGSEAPTCRNWLKQACPKCGGEYSINKSGRRYCPPCRLKFTKMWWTTPKGKALRKGRNWRTDDYRKYCRDNKRRLYRLRAGLPKEEA